jgi:hypothetical protein
LTFLIIIGISIKEKIENDNIKLESIEKTIEIKDKQINNLIKENELLKINNIGTYKNKDLGIEIDYLGTDFYYNGEYSSDNSGLIDFNVKSDCIDYSWETCTTIDVNVIKNQTIEDFKDAMKRWDNTFSVIKEDYTNLGEKSFWHGPYEAMGNGVYIYNNGKIYSIYLHGGKNYNSNEKLNEFLSIFKLLK